MYPSRQWAAVRTKVEEMRAPPQKLSSSTSMPTCQGYCPLADTLPLITLVAFPIAFAGPFRLRSVPYYMFEKYFALPSGTSIVLMMAPSAFGWSSFSSSSFDNFFNLLAGLMWINLDLRGRID
jgi:hypothetical protein